VVFDVRKFVAVRPSPVPAWPARWIEHPGFLSPSVLVFPWSMREWRGNGQHANPSTPDVTRLAARRASDSISVVRNSPTVGNRRRAQHSCGFQGNSKLLGGFQSFFPGASQKMEPKPIYPPPLPDTPKIHSLDNKMLFFGHRWG
jgi:hypothetical protein